MSYKPITKSEIEAILSRELEECPPFLKSVFVKYRVPLKKYALERYGNFEEVFVAAINGSEVMYYEDVEEGWNFSPVSEGGVLLEHGCNQDELKFALLHWSANDS